MSQTIKPAPVRKTVMVRAPQAHAFEVFTAGFTRWWPRSHHTGEAVIRDAFIEPGVGGRWYEVGQDGTESDWGDVLVWDPPARLVLAWRLGADFKYDPALLTEVEVQFIRETDALTRVEFEHRGLERMGENAGRARDAFESPSGWSGILTLFAAAADIERRKTT